MACAGVYPHFLGGLKIKLKKIERCGHFMVNKFSFKKVENDQN